MILDYGNTVDFSCLKSLRRFRRWISFRMANYVGCIEYRKETDKYFKNPELRPMGCDYREAIQNIEMIMNAHWAVNEIIKYLKDDRANSRSGKEKS